MKTEKLELGPSNGEVHHSETPCPQEPLFTTP